MKDVSPNLFILLTYFALQILQGKKKKKCRSVSVCKTSTVFYSFFISCELSKLHTSQGNDTEQKEKEGTLHVIQCKHNIIIK